MNKQFKQQLLDLAQKEIKKERILKTITTLINYSHNNKTIQRTILKKELKIQYGLN